jgi:hypothetical protein
MAGGAIPDRARWRAPDNRQGAVRLLPEDQGKRLALEPPLLDLPGTPEVITLKG